MPTLVDIAKKCNTSTATVSYVLSGKGDKHKISADMQKKIFETASEIGYRKNRVRFNPSDRALIAVCWPYRHFETSIAAITVGMSTAASDQIDPFDIIIKPFEFGKIHAHKELWQGGAVDSAIIVAAASDDIDYFEKNPPNIPIVLINREGTSFSDVSVDSSAVGELSALHAIHKGGEDICVVINPDPIFGLNTRAKKIIEICKEHNIDMANKVLYCKNTIEDGYELGLELIRKKRLPKIILCVYDMVGLGIMSALNEFGIKVGEDVELIANSTGLQGILARSSPPMTVVDLKMQEVTVLAIRLAVSLANKRVSAPQSLSVTPEIIYRASSPLN